MWFNRHDQTNPNWYNASNTGYNVTFDSMWIYVVGSIAGGILSGIAGILIGICHNKVEESAAENEGLIKKNSKSYAADRNMSRA